MDISTLSWWFGLLLGAIPLLLSLIWHWNDLRFVIGHKLRNGDCRVPRGHMGLPFLGETLSFLWYFKITGRPDDFINSKKKRYGEEIGLYRSHLFGKPTIIACMPASNKFILQSGHDFPIKWASPELVGVKSMLNLRGKEHERVRNFIVNEINKPDSLRRIAMVVQPRVVDALHSWSEKRTITAYLEIKKVTFQNICKMFVSVEPGPQLHMLDKLFDGLLYGFRAYPLNFPGTAFCHALKCRRKLDSLFKQEVERRKKRRMDDINYENKDLMDRFMDVKDEHGNHLSDDEIVHNMVSFVIGGYESTSLASMWALYHLSKEQEVLQKLREENAMVRKQERGEFISFEGTSQLKYTAKVVEESIRMANIAALVFRTAARNIEYRGFRIPEGWQVLVWLRSLHTDPKNFDDPLCFNPDRWNSPAKPGTYQVFGGGPRICPGNTLARLQLTILLHHIALGYKWKLVNSDAKIKYLPHPRPVDGGVMEVVTL